jgi:hypothetical protein
MLPALIVHHLIAAVISSSLHVLQRADALQFFVVRRCQTTQPMPEIYGEMSVRGGVRPGLVPSACSFHHKFKFTLGQIHRIH